MTSVVFFIPILFFAGLFAFALWFTFDSLVKGLPGRSLFGARGVVALMFLRFVAFLPLVIGSTFPRFGLRTQSFILSCVLFPLCPVFGCWSRLTVYVHHAVSVEVN